MKSKQKNSKRPKLLRISEETKQWSAMLEHELLGWPGVSSRPMFGFMAIYRNDTIFAGLPRSRALLTPNSIIFKVDPMPAELSALLGTVKGRADFELSMPKYGPGTLSVVST